MLLNDIFKAAAGTAGISIGDALFTSLLGLSLVFAVLAFLSLIMLAMGKILGHFRIKPTASEPAVSSAADTPSVSQRQPLRLINVGEKEAAMIMAIVADDSGIPLEHLDFKSIKLITEEE